MAEKEYASAGVKYKTGNAELDAAIAAATRNVWHAVPIPQQDSEFSRRGVSRPVAVAQLVLLGFEMRDAESALAEVGGNDVDAALVWLNTMKQDQARSMNSLAVMPPKKLDLFEVVVQKGRLPKKQQSKFAAKLRAYGILCTLIDDGVNRDNSLRVRAFQVFKNKNKIKTSTHFGRGDVSQFEGYSLPSCRIGSSFSRCASAATSPKSMRNTTPPVVRV
jgi:hypothetical protein